MYIKKQTNLISGKLTRVFILTLFTVLFSSCDKGFLGINTNPNAFDNVIPKNMLTSAQLSTASHDESFLVAVVKQHTTWNQGAATAGGTRYHHNWRTGFFNTVYNEQVAKSEVILSALSDSPEDINGRSIVRILRAYQYHRLTDLYGDVPYTEAVQGGEGNYTPEYDTQEFIYDDMLNELNEAAQALDPNQPSFGTGDLFYSGDVLKWKKFAYSLMLRLGMRLTKVAPQKAETWVKRAIEGGVIENNEDIAHIMYSQGSQIERNPRADAMLTSHYNTPQDPFNFLGGKIAKTYIDHMKATNDPRLEVVAVVWEEQDDGSYDWNNDPDLQKGMTQDWVTFPPDFGTYSEPHPETLLRYDSPMIFFTAEEANLLLAEAAVRGWYAGESAESAYNRAVRAGMNRWSLYGDGYSENVITDARINEYLAENPFLVNETFENRIEQISTQKWASLYQTDEYEQFSNWRRTGYPELEPTQVPGNQTGGTIPRRMVVPLEEERLNTENYNAAVERQGGPSWNDLTGRVWWDQE